MHVRGTCRGRLAAAAATLALAVLAAGCVQIVGPARTFDDYELKAKDTAESALTSTGPLRSSARR
jgi:hypothetical protein